MLSTLRLLLLGLWVGAMVGFAFLFAPTAFAQVGPTPQFAATIAASIRLLTRAGDFCGILAVAITVFGRLESGRMKAAIVAALTIAIVLGLVETQYLVNAMETTPLQTAAYGALHRRSSIAYSGVLLAALIAFILSAGGFADRRKTQRFAWKPSSRPRYK